MTRNGFGEQVNTLCKCYNLTNKEFAERCQIDEPSATRIRKGEIKPSRKIAKILLHLPENEAERVELQIELLLDYLNSISIPSPLLNVSSQADPSRLQTLLNSGHVSSQLKNAFETLIAAAVDAPHLAQSVIALADQIEDWNVTEKYSQQTQPLSLVAEPNTNSTIG